MFRALLGLLPVGLIPAAADSTSIELSPFMVQMLMLLAGGGWMAIYMARTKKRLEKAAGDKTEAETEEIYERLYKRLGGTHARLEQDVEMLQADLKQANAKLDVARAERQTIAAEHAEERTRLTMQIERLEEELATTRAQMGLDERRRSDDRLAVLEHRADLSETKADVAHEVAEKQEHRNDDTPGHA